MALFLVSEGLISHRKKCLRTSVQKNGGFFFLRLRKFLEVNVRIFLFLTCKASEMLSHDDILALPFTARELNHHSRERQAYHVFLSLCYQHIKSGSSSVLSLLHNRDMSSIVQASGTEIVPCNLSLELSDKSNRSIPQIPLPNPIKWNVNPTVLSWYQPCLTRLRHRFLLNE